MDGGISWALGTVSPGRSALLLFSAHPSRRLEVRGAAGEVRSFDVRGAMTLLEFGADYRVQRSGGQFVFVRAFQHQMRSKDTKQLQARLNSLCSGWNHPALGSPQSDSP